MAQNNQISATLPQAEVTEITNAINLIKSKMPFLKNLTVDERQGLAKMGDKSVAFANKAFEYGKQNPVLVPAFLNMAEYEKDANLVAALLTVARELVPLATALDDTLMMVGSEYLAAGRMIYKSAQAAANHDVPGARAIVEDLSARFPGGPRGGNNS